MVGQRITEPVPLLRKSTLTDLSVRELPEPSHLAKLSTASKLRTHYWIIDLLHICKHHIHKCVKCRLLNKRNANEFYRSHQLESSLLFTNVCIDLFQPYEVKWGLKTLKKIFS